MAKKKDLTGDHGIPDQCGRVVPTWLVLLDNVPTVALFLLGTAILWCLWPPIAIIYLIYCIISIILFWAIICPFCNHYDTRACPCGYGVIASKFFKPRKDRVFKDVFKKNIAIMYPPWVVPFVAGLIMLWTGAPMLILVLYILFCIVGFAAIPAISKYVGCAGCEIKDQCPWMT